MARSRATARQAKHAEQAKPTKPQTRRDDGTALIDIDPYLEPHAPDLRARYQHYQSQKQQFDPEGGLTGQVSQGHHYFGLNRGEKDGAPGVWYREWAPGAQSLALFGDFNDWDRTAHPLACDAYGVWHLFLPDADYADRLTHGSRLKVHVVGADGVAVDRIPAYIRRVVQDPPGTPQFVAIYWHPPESHTWRHDAPARHDGGLRVYEAHIGMAQEEGKVGTFDEFREHVLPRIAGLGYNAIQLMAIQEHPYYGSFGYHVSSFFAVSSRFGTPEQLKALIDEAHGRGLHVIMDLVHSHAIKNVHEGLNNFDGTGHQYFHAGARGEHTQWDSLCFDYSRYEVQRFLLSNIRFWLEEFGFDGFRFDGVTSMLYLDHGMGGSFTCYDDYFNDNVDPDAVAYLALANDLAHAVKPTAITLAEDMSGMPGLARPVNEGGLGFDYRLAMGVPDYWIKTLKHKRDEQWDMNELFHTLMNRRYGEKHIGYCESHDQALVGDKTIAFRLMDQDMYWHMTKFTENVTIDRGIALHKLIRLVTFSLAGEAYLNFMGNEFGHPEWIDFPREGNDFSYQYARRQWSLVDQDHLRYQGLWWFDQAMQQLDQSYALLEDRFIELLLADEQRKLLVYRRGPLLFAFNLHPSASRSDLRIPVPDACDYGVALDSDRGIYEGHDRVAPDMRYPWQKVACAERQQSIQLYLPSRSAQVLAPATDA